MLTISKSLSGGQARTYHAREFASEKANYWSRDQQGHSEWQGSLAQQQVHRRERSVLPVIAHSATDIGLLLRLL